MSPDAARQRLFAASVGERTVPGVPAENYWYRRHEVVYRALAGTAAARRVLDAGAGEGYGAAMLATTASAVVALDYDPPSVSHLATTYPEVAVVRGNLVGLPFSDGAFDLVVSLQTIEHLWDQPRFVSECARVTATGGAVVVATPNRRTFPAGNWFHTRELDADELCAVLEPALEHLALVGVHHTGALAAWEARHGSIVHAQLAVAPAAWTSALASAVDAVTVEDFELRPGGLDTCLDLVVTGRPRQGASS